MRLIPEIDAFKDELTSWRRHLHENPELGYEERDTARFVAEKLRAFGVDEVHEGIGETGVVGVLRAGKGEGSVLFRADMDALPIEEETNLPYASKRPGTMHACGHDGHTTMLLGAARHLAASRDFDGTVYLMFQPAEEGKGGAKAMLDEGLLERFPAERVFGLHNWPSLPFGRFAMPETAAMAAVDEFLITLTGKGGHAAMPHQTRDPLLAGCGLVQALQGIVSRETDPLDRAVLSVTTFNAGHAHNVIPETATIGGTVRSFLPETRARIEERIQAVADALALAHRVSAETSYRHGYPATVNHPAEAGIGADAAARVVGEDGVERAPLPAMVAEDFAYLLEAKPGSYVWMGTGGEAGLHSPHFDFNDEALPIGASYWVRLASALLPAA
ncbi:MAG: amidohydrolase [Geminicoccaceae bacterium]|nr:amidohydrolase [Geminicoccaceae bacterium]